MNETTYFVAAVAAVIFKGSRILAMKRSLSKDAGPGLWETLSGRIDLGEDPQEAIKREIKEECGLEVLLDPRPVRAYHATRKGQPMILIIYRAAYLNGRVILSHEHDEFAWLTPDEFAEISTLQKLVDVVYEASLLPPIHV
jgi:8-oxo-dGTP pyrophosphatase MutT (NUDIX family)